MRCSRCCSQHGVKTTFDHGAMYGDSSCAWAPGCAPPRTRSSSPPRPTKRTARARRASLERSRQRLASDVIDLIQLHNLVDERDWQVALGPGGRSRRSWRRASAGTCAFIGVHRPRHARRRQAPASSALPSTRCCCVQLLDAGAARLRGDVDVCSPAGARCPGGRPSRRSHAGAGRRARRTSLTAGTRDPRRDGARRARAACCSQNPGCSELLERRHAACRRCSRRRRRRRGATGELEADTHGSRSRPCSCGALGRDLSWRTSGPPLGFHFANTIAVPRCRP